MPRLPGKSQDIATSSNTSSNSFQVLWYVSQWGRALLAAPWKQVLRQTPPPGARPAKTKTSELAFRTLQKEDLGGPLLRANTSMRAGPMALTKSGLGSLTLRGSQTKPISILRASSPQNT